MVILNVVVRDLTFSFAPDHRARLWSFRAAAAFLVALFTEICGFPLAHLWRVGSAAIQPRRPLSRHGPPQETLLGWRRSASEPTPPLGSALIAGSFSWRTRRAHGRQRHRLATTGKRLPASTVRRVIRHARLPAPVADHPHLAMFDLVDVMRLPSQEREARRVRRGLGAYATDAAFVPAPSGTPRPADPILCSRRRETNE
jgi:hypothetical protein